MRNESNAALKQVLDDFKIFIDVIRYGYRYHCQHVFTEERGGLTRAEYFHINELTYWMDEVNKTIKKHLDQLNKLDGQEFRNASMVIELVTETRLRMLETLQSLQKKRTTHYPHLRQKKLVYLAKKQPEDKASLRAEIVTSTRRQQIGDLISVFGVLNTVEGVFYATEKYLQSSVVQRKLDQSLRVWDRVCSAAVPVPGLETTKKRKPSKKPVVKERSQFAQQERLWQSQQGPGRHSSLDRREKVARKKQLAKIDKHVRIVSSKGSEQEERVQNRQEQINTINFLLKAIVEAGRELSFRYMKALTQLRRHVGCPGEGMNPINANDSKLQSSFAEIDEYLSFMEKTLSPLYRSIRDDLELQRETQIKRTSRIEKISKVLQQMKKRYAGQCLRAERIPSLQRLRDDVGCAGKEFEPIVIDVSVFGKAKPEIDAHIKSVQDEITNYRKSLNQFRQRLLSVSTSSKPSQPKAHSSSTALSKKGV